MCADSATGGNFCCRCSKTRLLKAVEFETSRVAGVSRMIDGLQSAATQKANYAGVSQIALSIASRARLSRQRVTASNVKMPSATQIRQKLTR